MAGDGKKRAEGLARKSDELFCERSLALVERIEEAVEMRRRGYEYREIERWLVKNHGIKHRQARKYKAIVKARLAKEVEGDQRAAWHHSVSMAMRAYRGAAEAKVTLRRHVEGTRGEYVDEEVDRPDYKSMIAAGRWYSDLWGLSPKLAVNLGSGNLEEGSEQRTIVVVQSAKDDQDATGGQVLSAELRRRRESGE